MLCKSFNFVSFDTFEKEAVNFRHERARPGRAGSGRAGSSWISVLHKKVTFCYMNHATKINISRVMMLLCFPI